MSAVTFTHVGGPTMLIEAAGWRILTDPTFDPPGGRVSFGWGTFSRKLTGPAVAFRSLTPVDAVLISHEQHRDNLDQLGRRHLPEMGQIITTRDGAGRLRLGAQGLDPWETTVLEAPGKPTIEVTATPCRHGPPGSRPIVGDVIGFSLRWVDQTHGALWISGDTTYYPGLRRVWQSIPIGTAVLHLGGVQFPWVSGPLRYTMTAADAVRLARQIEPQTLIPIHTEGWRHFVEAEADARETLAHSAYAHRVRWLDAGQPTVLEV
jgi:L-ascorbate metabolism protein UlaG (beta-lactamase superfamily)